MSDVALRADPLDARLERHRAELTGYCYRMLGSAADAEDAVQETMTRAWRGYDRFEGRAGLRTWLYRIASNVCFDALRAGRRRALPMDLGPGGDIDAVGEPLAPVMGAETWVEPIADAAVVPPEADPALVAQTRASVRLALVAALQHLPPRQRAVLILRDVLRWKADETAELLGVSVAAANSALQRARATLATRDLELLDVEPAPDDPAQQELLERYSEAFERYDMSALAVLLREDAQQSMPPYPMWLRGRDAMLAWMTGPGADCRGSRLVRVQVNGTEGFAQYRDGGATPWAIHVLDVRDGRIAEITYFLETDGRVFAAFGLPPRLEA